MSDTASARELPHRGCFKVLSQRVRESESGRERASPEPFWLQPLAQAIWLKSVYIVVLSKTLNCSHAGSVDTLERLAVNIPTSMSDQNLVSEPVLAFYFHGDASQVGESVFGGIGSISTAESWCTCASRSTTSLQVWWRRSRTTQAARRKSFNATTH